jgi:hypothetical protein
MPEPMCLTAHSSDARLREEGELAAGGQLLTHVTEGRTRRGGEAACEGRVREVRSRHKKKKRKKETLRQTEE